VLVLRKLKDWPGEHPKYSGTFGGINVAELLADYMLPSTGSTLKTSQIVGLQKTDLRPEPSHPLMTASNFAAERGSVPEPEQRENKIENQKREKRNRTHDPELH
jgi:hypothetical protein